MTGKTEIVHVVLNGLHGNRKVADSTNFPRSNTFVCASLFQRLLIIKVIYWPVYHLFCLLDFFSYGQALCQINLESLEIFRFSCFLIQFVRKWKEKSHSFKIFSGNSPPAALFEDKSLIMSFTSSSETGLTENFPVSLRLRLIFVILGW